VDPEYATTYAPGTVLLPNGQPAGGAAAARRPSGAILVDGQQVADTLQCVHCGGHFVMIRGSGRRRGFCTLCHGITCGSAGCVACVPTEQWLDQVERAHQGG